MSDDFERAQVRTRPRRRSRSSGAILNTPSSVEPSPDSVSSKSRSSNVTTAAGASISNGERTLLPSDVMELRRSASADHVVGAGGASAARASTRSATAAAWAPPSA